MIKFSECSISKVIEYGTNLSCIEGRTIVCKVIKGFVLDTNNVMFEKGDIVVCRTLGDDKISLSEQDYIRGLSSDSFIADYFFKGIENIEYDAFYQYKMECSLEKFKETFEVMDEETAALESCIKKSKDSLQSLDKKKLEVSNIQDKYKSKADLRQGVVGAVLGVIGTALFGMTIPPTDTFLGNLPYPFNCLLCSVGIIMAATGGIFCIFAAEEGAFECFESKNTPLLDKSEEDYKDQHYKAVKELDTFRQQAGWLIS